MYIIIYSLYTEFPISLISRRENFQFGAFRESKIPNMRGTGPIPNEAKKIAVLGSLICPLFI